MRRTANGRRVYALADYTVEKRDTHNTDSREPGVFFYAMKVMPIKISPE